MAEDLFGDAGSVIIGPSSDLGIQCRRQSCLIATSVFVNGFCHGQQVALLGLFAGFDKRLVAATAVVFASRVLTDVEAEEVETYITLVLTERVSDASFGRFQV